MHSGGCSPRVTLAEEQRRDGGPNVEAHWSLHIIYTYIYIYYIGIGYIYI